jgi:hypothetical protein
LLAQPNDATLRTELRKSSRRVVSFEAWAKGRPCCRVIAASSERRLTASSQPTRASPDHGIVGTGIASGIVYRDNDGNGSIDVTFSSPREVGVPIKIR